MPEIVTAPRRMAKEHAIGPNGFLREIRRMPMASTESHDAIAMLREDHRTVEKLFKEFEEAKGNGRKEKLAHEISLALSVHAAIEEEIFYPACEIGRAHV